MTDEIRQEVKENIQKDFDDLKELIVLGLTTDNGVYCVDTFQPEDKAQMIAAYVYAVCQKDADNIAGFLTMVAMEIGEIAKKINKGEIPMQEFEGFEACRKDRHKEAED